MATQIRPILTIIPADNVKETNTELVKKPYKCVCCGKRFAEQKNNFPKTQSPLYTGNNFYLDVCKECVDDICTQYEDHYNNIDEAIKRMCLHFDIYLDEKILKSIKNKPNVRSRILEYFRQGSMKQNAGKTFDTNLQEGKQMDDIVSFGKENVTSEMVKFWGHGYPKQAYLTLQGYYNDLLDLCDGKPDIKKQKMMKALCLQEYQIGINVQSGKDIGTLSNSYKSMFEAAELKQNEADVSNDTFGKWLQEIEQYCPADYYLDKKKYHDFFGIVEYINRFLYRPLKNLVTGSKEPEKEYWIPDEESNGE